MDGPCVFKDDIENTLMPKMLEADMLVLVTPLYYYGMKNTGSVLLVCLRPSRLTTDQNLKPSQKLKLGEQRFTLPIHTVHAYTIREAIADRNVLGFKVDFETTINEEQMRTEYLPAFYRERYPQWTEEQVREKVQNLSPEDMDDAVEPSFYDENPQHIALVVEDIFKNWRNRSNDGKYNALFTTHERW